MFNAIMREGVWLQAFKESNSVVIPKLKSDNYDIPKLFRPIALFNCLAKLFTKYLTKRLQDEVRRYQIFHPLQFGGMQHHSTLDAATTLFHEIKPVKSGALITPSKLAATHSFSKPTKEKPYLLWQTQHV